MFFFLRKKVEVIIINKYCQKTSLKKKMEKRLIHLVYPYFSPLQAKHPMSLTDKASDSLPF